MGTKPQVLPWSILSAIDTVYEVVYECPILGLEASNLRMKSQVFSDSVPGRGSLSHRWDYLAVSLYDRRHKKKAPVHIFVGFCFVYR